MVDYRKILHYYSKGNNNSQIATICCCSRKTVIKVVSRAKELNLEVPVPNRIKDYNRICLPNKVILNIKSIVDKPDIHIKEKCRISREEKTVVENLQCISRFVRMVL